MDSKCFHNFFLYASLLFRSVRCVSSTRSFSFGVVYRLRQIASHNELKLANRNSKMHESRTTPWLSNNRNESFGRARVHLKTFYKSRRNEIINDASQQKMFSCLVSFSARFVCRKQVHRHTASSFFFLLLRCMSGWQKRAPCVAYNRRMTTRKMKICSNSSANDD